MKLYYTLDGVGKAKYTVSSHDGVATHKDGSPFYGIAIFSNKRERDKHVRHLIDTGHTPRSFVSTSKQVK